MLSLTHNKDTRKTTLTPNVDAILKRSHNELLVIRLVDGDNELFQLSGDQSLLVVLKPKPYRELSLLVADGDDHGILIDEDDYDAETRTYRKAIDLYTVPINTLLNIDGDSSNDIASAPCVAEVSFSLEPGDDWEPGTTLDFTLENAIMSDEDSTPASVADPDADWVAHGHAQTLTDPQKTQARDNIGAASAATVPGPSLPMWTYTSGAMASGKMRTDNVDPSNTGSIEFSVDTKNGATSSGTAMFNGLPPAVTSQRLMLANSAGQVASFAITAVADNGTFFTLTVTPLSSAAANWSGDYQASLICLSPVLTVNGQIGNVTIASLSDDSGWSANASAGDKTVVVADFAGGGGLSGVDSTADQQLINLTKKLQALEAALAANLRPNA